VDVLEIYVNLIPSEWKLPGGDNPVIWVFTVTKDFKTLLGATPLGAIHCKFPFDLLEPETEAYGAWNRGIPETVQPIEDTMNWLINTHFYNTRASLNNLFVADPTKLVMKDLTNPSPGGLIRMKPEAYGQDIRTFFSQLKIADVTGGHMNDLSSMFSIGEKVMGINEQMLGSLGMQAGVTATQVRTSTGFGVNRMKTITEYMSAVGFEPHAEKLVMNSQQFYTGEKKFRIVGSLAQQAGEEFIVVDPSLIAGGFGYVPVDGTLPIDRTAQVGLWTQLLQQMTNFPQVLLQYDITKIFGWVAGLAGIKNIEQFRVQVAPDEVLRDQAAAGNLVASPQRAPDPDTRSTGVQF
jgi:hypothetical protein